MTTGVTVVVASICAVGLKLTGHLVPSSVLSHPRIVRIPTLLPAALLAALVVQAVTTSGRLVADARLVGLAAAALALLLRAPFIVVVVVAAAAAGVRAAGWG